MIRNSCKLVTLLLEVSLSYGSTFRVIGLMWELLKQKYTKGNFASVRDELRGYLASLTYAYAHAQAQ